MRQRIILFFYFLLLYPSFSRAELVVWNVGQGQWVTRVFKSQCLHFDIGGEINVSREVLKLCQGKLQILNISHWDYDHISFALKFSHWAGHTCLAKWPQGKASPWKQKMLRQIPLCADLEKQSKYYLYIPSSDRKMKANDLSSVFVVGNVLLPGDSPAKMEKLWAEKVPDEIHGLVLGHHGSRTSTSDFLLDRLPRLKWAVASARKEKYGHPHPLVVQRLKKKRIPWLATEDWGHLHFLD